MNGMVQMDSAMTLTCPFFGALFALVLLLLDTFRFGTKKPRENRLLIGYFLMVTLSLSQIMLVSLNPKYYILTSPLNLFTHALMQIFFYGYVFELTKTNLNERFNMWHYGIAATICVIILILPWGVPKSALYIILNGDAFAHNGNTFLKFMGNVYLVKLSFSVFYLIMGIVRLFRYRSFIQNYSANEEKTSLRWLHFQILLMIIALPFPYIWIYLMAQMKSSSLLMVCYSMFIFLMYAYLIVHVIRDDKVRVQLTPEDLPEDFKKSARVPVEDLTNNPVIKKEFLQKVQFDELMARQKPYLNPDLRITDLVDLLHVNRTYISAYINNEYGMNFSAFINHHRMEEYQRICQLPENHNKSKQEKAEMAGFNSYRSFLRIQKSLQN